MCDSHEIGKNHMYFWHRDVDKAALFHLNSMLNEHPSFHIKSRKNHLVIGDDKRKYKFLYSLTYLNVPCSKTVDVITSIED